MGAIVLGVPIIVALLLPAADIVATFSRGTPQFTMPLYSPLYRVAAIGVPIICFAVARALTSSVIPMPCMLP
jgi:hypothetical protein